MSTFEKSCYALAFIILILGLIIPNQGRAETRLYLGALTKHFSSEDYNERHKLVMLEHNGFVGGYFNNSYDEDSFLLGYKWRTEFLDLPVPHLETSIVTAATYGYRDCIKGWADSDRRVCGMPVVQFDYTKHETIHPSFLLTPVFVGVTGAINF